MLYDDISSPSSESIYPIPLSVSTLNISPLSVPITCAPETACPTLTLGDTPLYVVFVPFEFAIVTLSKLVAVTLPESIEHTSELSAPAIFTSLPENV